MIGQINAMYHFDTCPRCRLTKDPTLIRVKWIAETLLDANEFMIVQSILPFSNFATPFPLPSQMSLSGSQGSDVVSIRVFISINSCLAVTMGFFLLQKVLFQPQWQSCAISLPMPIKSSDGRYYLRQTQPRICSLTIILYLGKKK